MINDCKGGISARPDGETRRFAPAYKQSLEQIAVSDELRSRILTAVPMIAVRNPKKQWLRAAGGVAACLAAVVAAGSLIPRTEMFSLTVQENAACETVSSSSAAAAVETPIGGAYGGAEAGASSAESFAVTAASAPDAEDTDGAAAGGQDTGVSLSDTENAPDAGSEEETAPETAQPAETGYSDTAGEGVPLSGGVSPYSAGEDGLSPSKTASDGSESAEAETRDAAGDVSPNLLSENPTVFYPSAEEAFAALGWTLPLPEGLSGSVSVTGGALFQLDTADGGCFRAGKSGTWGEDVSGDYNSYAYDVRIETDGLSLRLRGDRSGEALLVSWTSGGFSFSYAPPAAMTEEEALALAESISG